MTLKRPNGISHVYINTGRALNVGLNGTIEVFEEEVIPLKQAGLNDAPPLLVGLRFEGDTSVAIPRSAMMRCP